MLVDAEHHEVALVRARHGVAGRLDLVEHDLDLLAARPFGRPGTDALRDELGRLSGLSAPQRRILAYDDDVEVLGRHRAELDHVLVSPVTGRGDHADARRLGQVAARLQALSDSLPEEALDDQLSPFFTSGERT